jgi:hypothetical protein
VAKNFIGFSQQLQFRQPPHTSFFKPVCSFSLFHYAAALQPSPPDENCKLWPLFPQITLPVIQLYALNHELTQECEMFSAKERDAGNRTGKRASHCHLTVL